MTCGSEDSYRRGVCNATQRVCHDQAEREAELEVAPLIAGCKLLRNRSAIRLCKDGVERFKRSLIKEKALRQRAFEMHR